MTWWWCHFQAKVWLDKGLTPLRAYMSATVPEIQVRFGRLALHV